MTTALFTILLKKNLTTHRFVYYQMQFFLRLKIQSFCTKISTLANIPGRLKLILDPILKNY